MPEIPNIKTEDIKVLLVEFLKYHQITFTISGKQEAEEDFINPYLAYLEGVKETTIEQTRLGNVLQDRKKNKIVVMPHNIDKIHENISEYTYICRIPHEDSDFTYRCNRTHCRCSK